MEDGIGMIAVIGKHVIGEYFVRLEFVGSGNAGARSSRFVDIGAVRVEPELVDLSQAGVNVERG